jgi:hypothetical protein
MLGMLEANRLKDFILRSKREADGSRPVNSWGISG